MEDKVVTKWPLRFLGLQMAHDAMMLEDARNILKLDREGTRKHQLRLHKGPEPEAGDDVIHVGDAITHVHPESPRAGLSKTATALIAAASLLGGGGGALGFVSLLKAPVAQLPIVPPAVAKESPLPEAIDLRVKWWVEDGQIKSKVEPEVKP